MGSPLAPWEGASGRRAGRDGTKEGGSRVNICAVGGRGRVGRGWRVEVGVSKRGTETDWIRCCRRSSYCSARAGLNLLQLRIFLGQYFRSCPFYIELSAHPATSL